MKEKAQFLDIDALARHTELLRDCHVIIGSEYEPTIHPQFDKLLRLAIDREWKVDFLTNGTNLHRYDAAQLADVRFHVFNASFDGFSKESFERIRRGAEYENTLGNILKAAETARCSGAYTAINATILRSNLHETADLVRMWDAAGFDLVRLLIMQVRSPDESLYQESLYPVAEELAAVLDDVARMVVDERLRIGVFCGYFGTPDFVPPKGATVEEMTVFSGNSTRRHVPRVRQNFQLGSWPGMSWPCRSPFVYARIRWDGAVDLCNRRDFAIGNIYERPFEEIWRGSPASSQRRLIQEDRSICETCDYFRFCINLKQLQIQTPEGHFSNGILRHSGAADWLTQQSS